MGCCATSHPGVQELEVVLRLDEQANLSQRKDSFLDVPLTSKPESMESYEDEMPEPLFFMHSTGVSIEAYLRSQQRSKTMAMKGHSRTTSLRAEPSGTSTVASLKEALAK